MSFLNNEKLKKENFIRKYLKNKWKQQKKTIKYLIQKREKFKALWLILQLSLPFFAYYWLIKLINNNDTKIIIFAAK